MGNLSWIKGCFFVLVICISALQMSSCAEDDASTIGFSNNTNSYRLVYLDTFTVKTSTVLMDSIRTSGTGRILLGRYEDSKTGKVSSSSYFSIAPSTWTLDEDAIYDSIALILNYDGYYYGDTLVSQKVKVTRLSQDIMGRSKKDPYLYDDIPYSFFYSEGSLYNSSSLNDFNSDILGSKTYYPRPLTNDSLTVPISDDLGREWFSMKKLEDSRINSDADFSVYFKGLKITTESADGASVIGFNSATARIRIYYRTGIEGTDLYDNSYHDFAIYNSTLQFNQLTTIRTGTALNSMMPFVALPSEQTNNETFVQAGGGVMTKIEFPYISKIFEEHENVILSQASLEVVPEVNGSSTADLPTTLSLYYTNSTNIPIGQIVSETESSQAQTATLVTDNEFEKKASYTFIFTTYFSNLLKKNNNYPYSILLGTTSTDFIKEVTKVRIGNGKGSDSEIKLKLYITTY